MFYSRSDWSGNLQKWRRLEEEIQGSDSEDILIVMMGQHVQKSSTRILGSCYEITDWLLQKREFWGNDPILSEGA